MHALKPGFASILDHPAWQAAVNAPVVAETDEEREAVVEALRSGPVITGAQVTAEISRRSER
ncbi:MAG TPA: hypothetical protein PK156_09570 [Polyangium sp.]|nr:hypothetical protein [Polyangium sp.]